MRVVSVHQGSLFPGPTEFLDFTVDGRGLRAMFDGEDDVTRLNSGWDSDAVRAENLARLLGQPIPPEHVRRFHRTRLDRLFLREGKPYSFSETAFQDGRVGLLYCRCGDMDCGVLSTRVGLTPDTVVWHDIAWQRSCGPPVPPERVGAFVTVVFGREQYEGLLRSLLGADWTEGVPSLV
jgi:hypothetical protein